MSNKLPNLDIEKKFLNQGLICGIDEVGRGSLAGPVVAAAVILNFNNIPLGINDSKNINKVKRHILYEKIIDVSKNVAFGESSTQEIDKLNILNASLLAMKRAYYNLSIKAEIALVDGNFSPTIKCNVFNIIKGDSKSLSIAAASIIAKVYRDNILKSLDKKFPKYNFKNNAGYGTKEHYAAINKFGISPYHRKSFKLYKQKEEN
tara:strand:+ start:39052 stop:39666 length:615 start_codon:yes stop_codon:yes gene_type:complete